MSICPICEAPLSAHKVRRIAERDVDEVDCDHCGCFNITGTAKAIIHANHVAVRSEPLSNLAHATKKCWEISRETLSLTSQNVERILQNADRPDIATQADYLVLWLGNKQVSPSNVIEANLQHLMPLLGVNNETDVGFVIVALLNEQIVHLDTTTHFGKNSYKLTFNGWKRYHQLKKGTTESNRVFMAMKFNDQILDTLFNDYYKPALVSLGLQLFRLDEEPKAGSITNRMRVAIKEAKFVIADLSYGNRGAYWEAGYKAWVNRLFIA